VAFPGDEGSALIQQIRQGMVGQTVVDQSALTTVRNQVCLAQGGKLLGDVRLSLAQQRSQVTHTGLPASQDIKDAQPDGMGQRTEQLCLFLVSGAYLHNLTSAHGVEATLPSHQCIPFYEYIVQHSRKNVNSLWLWVVGSDVEELQKQRSSVWVPKEIGSGPVSLAAEDSAAL
jgi:hypothetical protein